MNSTASVTAVDLYVVLDLEWAVAEFEREAAALSQRCEFEIDDLQVDRSMGRARATLESVAQKLFDWSGAVITQVDGHYEIDLRQVDKFNANEADLHREEHLGLGDLRWLAGIAPGLGLPSASALLYAYINVYVRRETGFNYERQDRLMAHEYTAMARLLKGGK